jgi:hypothetical protein
VENLDPYVSLLFQIHILHKNLLILALHLQLCIGSLFGLKSRRLCPPPKVVDSPRYHVVCICHQPQVVLSLLQDIFDKRIHQFHRTALLNCIQLYRWSA